MADLYYFHDPMCSWCWGFRPTAEKLFASLPENVVRRNILGGLAPDSDVPMPKDQQQAIQGHWRRIESLLGTEFNHDFWTNCEPRRSTYPACRAVIAASNQSGEELMTLAIQKAYYLHAQNPSDARTLVEIAGEAGFDAERFEADLESPETEAELQRQISFTGHCGARGFPSLYLSHGGKLTQLSVDYTDHHPTLREISNLVQ